MPSLLRRGYGSVMHPILHALWTQHGASSVEKIHYIWSLIEGLDWRVDLDRGEIYYGDQHTWKIQLLGSEAHAAGTWLWSWANQQMSLPPEVSNAARSLRAFGEERNIPELREGSFEVDEELNGEFIATIAAGALRAHGYVMLPYEGGQAYALVTDPDFPAVDPTSLVWAPRAFATFLSLRPVDGRKAWRHFLKYHQLTASEDGDTITGDGPGGSMVATFDEQGRMTNINAKLTSS